MPPAATARQHRAKRRDVSFEAAGAGDLVILGTAAIFCGATESEKAPAALEPMDTTLVVGLVLLLVVGFFAYQWWAKSGRSITGGTKRLQAAGAVPAPTREPAGTGGAGVPGNVLAAAQAAAATASPMRAEEPSPDAQYPRVAGQTEAEMRTREPTHRPQQGPQPQGVGHESYGPVPTPENLRHPEQMFHQPEGAAAVPSMRISDVESGRSAPVSTPLAGNQQAFSPEMAQNGGALVGNTMFAFDGMEPTGFAAF